MKENRLLSQAAVRWVGTCCKCVKLTRYSLSACMIRLATVMNTKMMPMMYASDGSVAGLKFVFSRNLDCGVAQSPRGCLRDPNLEVSKLPFFPFDARHRSDPLKPLPEGITSTHVCRATEVNALQLPCRVLDTTAEQNLRFRMTSSALQDKTQFRRTATLGPHSKQSPQANLVRFQVESCVASPNLQVLSLAGV